MLSSYRAWHRREIMNENQYSASHGLLPPAFVLIAGLLMTGLHLVVPWVQLLPIPWRLFGVVPVAGGGWMTANAA